MSVTATSGQDVQNRYDGRLNTGLDLRQVQTAPFVPPVQEASQTPVAPPGVAPINQTAGVPARAGPEPAGQSPGNGTGARLELGLQPNLNGAGATFSLGRETLNGAVAWSGTIELGRQLGVEVAPATRGAAGGSASATNGIAVNFELVTPRGNTMTMGELRNTINPLDPRTLPPGASVKIDLAQFAGTEYEAQIRQAVLSEGVRFEAGVTYQASRSADGESGDRAIGPYAMMEQSAGFGGTLGPVTAQLGRTTQVRDNLLAKESLDLSGPETVSRGVSRTTTLEYVSESGLNLGIDAGLFDAQLRAGLRENASLTTLTQEPDGSVRAATSLYYDEAPPLTIERRFAPDGTEIASARTYQYSVTADEHSRSLLHVALGGSVETAGATPIRAGDTVVLSYDTQAMAALQQQHRVANQTSMVPSVTAPGGWHDFRMMGLDPQTSFAVAQVRNGFASQYSFAHDAFEVASFADGAIDGSYARNPADAWIVRPNGESIPFRP